MCFDGLYCGAADLDLAFAAYRLVYFLHANVARAVEAHGLHRGRGFESGSDRVHV